jgi:predicted kinase
MIHGPVCYQLVGVPGAGKSTWIQTQDWLKECVVVSTDVHVEAYAKSMGKTYSEVFDEYMPTAVRLMTNEVVAARQAGKNIIWDQTSTTIGSRKKKFNMLPEYKHIAVVFRTPPQGILLERLASRPGKIIPSHVVESMINGFEMPTEDEGYKEIWYVN